MNLRNRWERSQSGHGNILPLLGKASIQVARDFFGHFKPPIRAPKFS